MNYFSPLGISWVYLIGAPTCLPDKAWNEASLLQPLPEAGQLVQLGAQLAERPPVRVFEEVAGRGGQTQAQA